MQFDKYVALDILNRVHISIEHIEERSYFQPPISYIYPLFKGLFECKGKRLINVSNFIGH